MAKLIFVQDVPFADDCHWAVALAPKVPIVRVIELPLQMVVWLAVGAGGAPAALVSVR